MTGQDNATIKSICMLSTHGYFDPVPELGQTDTGGQVLYVLQLARALSRLGVHTDIYTRWFDRSRKQIDPLPDCPDVRVIRIPAGDWTFIPKEWIYPVLDELARNLVEFLNRNTLSYDLFHGHYVDAGIVALKAARLLSRPCFFTAHSLGAWKRERMSGDREKLDEVFNFTLRINEELRLFREVTAQTITSREEGEKIVELYGFDSPRIGFIPPGVDIHRFRPLAPGEEEEETRIALPDNYIFVVSRLSRAKGHDLLLPAFLQVVKKVPDIHLVVAGGATRPDEEEQGVVENMKQFIRAHGLEKKVHLVGGIPHEDLPPYFRKSRLFVLPARYEPFGMTVLEAMACGVPAVVSTFSGIQENLVSQRDCLKINPLETGEYSQTIVRLLNDQSLRGKLVKNGLQTVRAEFSWEAIARRHLAFYHRHIHG